MLHVSVSMIIRMIDANINQCIHFGTSRFTHRIIQFLLTTPSYFLTNQECIRRETHSKRFYSGTYRSKTFYVVSDMYALISIHLRGKMVEKPKEIWFCTIEEPIMKGDMRLKIGYSRGELLFFCASQSIFSNLRKQKKIRFIFSFTWRLGL